MSPPPGSNGSACLVAPFSGPRAGQPAGLQPVLLGGQGLRAPVERPQERATYWREVRPPEFVGIRLDVAGPADGKPAQGGEVHRLRVEAVNLAPAVNHQLHGPLRSLRGPS